MTTQLDQARNEKARTAAQAAVDGLAVTPTGRVQYHSRGRVLVVGDEDAQLFAARIEAPLHAQVMMTAGEAEPGVPVIGVGGRAVKATGHLGNFHVELGEAGKHNFEAVDVDLIVDISDQPLFTSELPPPGYFRHGKEPQELDAALLELSGMVGTFEKPKFFQYDPDICAHGRSGQPGCNACVEVCPAEAITALAERVEVNPNLCQGGGVCAAVCPTGAMEYAYPSPQDTQQRLRGMLKAYREHDGTHPVVLFVAEEDVHALDATPPNVLMLVVEELGSVGLDLWLSALAWGASCVLLADGDSLPVSVHKALDDQLATVGALLGGMGYPENAVRLVKPAAVLPECEPAMPALEPAAFGAMEGKRTRSFFALDHLNEQSAAEDNVIDLPIGAPFGRISVNGEACTLCMSCTSICPAKAVRTGDGEPKLVFHETNCVQCGICANACPEHAISLKACYTTDPELRRQPATLYEEPPFHCVVCGKPFATRSVIDNMMEKLAGHYMFQNDRAKRRLMMCEDCRVVDVVQDQDAMEAGMDVRPPRQ
ncbi:MAG: 4Fe-4S binding protein [Gammaproteobacteria bacterium]